VLTYSSFVFSPCAEVVVVVYSSLTDMHYLVIAMADSVWTVLRYGVFLKLGSAKPCQVVRETKMYNG
jgi:hypothetical protein